MSLARLSEGRIGWRRDGRVVASARVSRADDELVIADLQSDDDDGAAALLGAVAGAATSAARLVDTDGRVVREITVSPVDRPQPLTLARLEESIRAAWSAETSDRPGEWTTENPAFQQCDVTARVVQDYLGGDILVAGVILDGRRVDRHAWNRLPSGLELDLSREQFLRGEQFEAPEVLEEFLGQEAEERYALLAARVRERLLS